MTVRYEWQERRGGRRYRRIVEPDAPVKVDPVDVAEAEAVPEVKIEPAEVVAAPKRGRPKKAPVVIKDE